MIRSLSRAPIKKDVLQQCGDCGLNFEGLDELRDHLKVVFSHIQSPRLCSLMIYR